MVDSVEAGRLPLVRLHPVGCPSIDVPHCALVRKACADSRHSPDRAVVMQTLEDCHAGNGIATYGLFSEVSI